MGIGRVLALRFHAGAIVLFIRWQDGAERRAGFWPVLSENFIRPGFAGEQNHCIIRYAACDPAFARDIRRRHI